MPKKVVVPVEAPVKLVDQPRPWAAIRAGTVGDYRWRGIPAKVTVIDMTRAHEQRQRARHGKKAGA